MPRSNWNIDKLVPLDFVPQQYRGTDRFLDVVNWNIRYFNARDPKRVEAISRILEQINADVFVLEEILDQSLAPVVERLGNEGAGYYEPAYGGTGGSQRVAIMYDTDWVRAKDDVRELFGKGQVTIPSGGRRKDVFPRLPLWGYFQAMREERGRPPFDFQLVGLHLKSQRTSDDAPDREDARQRAAAADALAEWMETDGSDLDSDIILLGDWNKEPTAPEWRAFRELEERELAAFTKINDEGDISHLMYRNRNQVGSRLDLQALSYTALDNVYQPKTAGSVIRWQPVDQLMGKSALKDKIKELRALVSDHMPVLTRFYFSDR
jgi:endonuclease/exonuclease/phosphatase family metal-dependent hydrolase